MSSGGRNDLLLNAAVTGSDAIWPGGKGTFMAEGTFGGATITLQVKSPNGSYIAVSATTTLTANGTATFDLAPSLIRAAVSGGAPSALFAYAIQIPSK